MKKVRKALQIMSLSSTGTSMKPCAVCLGLDRLSVEPNRWQLNIKADFTAEYSLKFESSQLSASVESGCETCSIISRGLGLISRNLLLFDASRAYRGRLILQPDCPLEVEILDEDPEEEEDSQLSARARVQFYTLRGIDGDSYSEGRGGPFAVARDIPPELSVERCSSIVSNWITNCRLNHSACSTVRSDANELPRRLLDLKQREGAAVVLVETRDNADCHVEQYATLSHCWGKAHIIQTTKENLTHRMQGIEWDRLPKTFQDAITVVRALSVRFLWIDSLCIVQDDMLDWKQESVRMFVIYSNSYINIAATGASDSRGGCLYPRSLRHLEPICAVKSFAVNVQQYSQSPTTYVRPSLERVHQRYSTRRSHETDLPDSQIVPLLSRAWVFQERHLAPRTLHFHPSEMVMECKASLCCECSGLDKVVSLTRRDSLHLKSSHRSDIFTAWLDAVEEYSKLRLTRESDRLPALTGVATVFQKKLGCGYLAGIWQDDIARGILWGMSRDWCVQSKRSIRQHDAAPTWSWASLILDNEGFGIMFPAGHDDTFQVDNRFLFLETDIPFAATDFTPITPTMESILVRGVSVAATAHPHSLDDFVLKDLVLVFEQDIEDIVLVTVAEMTVDCNWKSPDARPLQAGSTVHCLLVGSKVDTDLESGKKTRYQCTLVLKPSSSDTQMLERVGVMTVKEDLGIFHLGLESSLKLI